jgi:hypothetical protein
MISARPALTHLVFLDDELDVALFVRPRRRRVGPDHRFTLVITDLVGSLGRLDQDRVGYVTPASLVFGLITKVKSVNVGVVVVRLDFGQGERGPRVPGLDVYEAGAHLIRAPAAAGDSFAALASP